MVVRWMFIKKGKIMIKLIAYYYLWRCERKYPNYKFGIRQSTISKSLYIKRRANSGRHDYIRISDHKPVKHKTNYIQRKFFGLYIGYKRTGTHSATVL